MSSTITSSRFRLIAALVATLMIAAVLTATTTPAEAAGKRGAGYPITKTRAAASGWLGAHRVAGKNVYRLQPTKRDVRTGYKSRKSLVSGGPKVSQAAWVLAKYGKRRERTQAAAVNAVVYELVAGKKFAVNSKWGRNRIRQARYASTIRSYAKTMKTEARTHAGPYKTSLTGTNAPAGSASKLTFTIRTVRTGVGLSGAPVTFSYPGSAPVRTYTNTAGVAVANVKAVAGHNTARASVSGVPEWRLVVKHPRNRRASKVALAGVHRSLSASTSVLGTTTQTVSVSNSTGNVLVGQKLAGTRNVTGGVGTRSTKTTIHGPLASSSSPCGAPIRYTWNGTTAGGPAPLPTYTAPLTGYYRWQVVVGGNSSTASASTCGASVRVQKRATVGQARSAGVAVGVKANKQFDVDVKISGFDRSESHTVTSRLYGPFASQENVRCAPLRQARVVNKTISGNGTHDMPNVTLGTAHIGKWFGWQSTLNSGNFILGSSSTCGIVYKVVE